MFSQLKEIFPLHIEAKEFIQKNRLWKGLFEMKWVFWISVIFTIIFSIQFISVFLHWVTDIFLGQQGGSSFISSAAMVSNIQFFGNELFVSGGIKYLIFIFAEVIIFHVTVTTINILSGEKQQPKFKDFLAAEKRMIKVSLSAWFFEVLISSIIGLFLSMLGLSFLKRITDFIVEFYFMGHLFLDNYNEQFGLTVKESFRHIRQHAGAAIGIGLVAYCLFLIPIVGMILAPVLGAVTGALYMYTHEVHAEKERIYEFV